ncbi:MAG: hypothetical protein Q8Q13_00660 [bacterium]|nr:hypothetical protein [bacterium]
MQRTLLTLSYVLFPALLLGFFVLIIAPYFVHAAEAIKCTNASFCPLADVKGSRLEALYSTDQNLVTYLKTLFKMAISVGAIAAVLRLVYAGYIYMAGDVWTTKEKAKGIFRDVFLGLFLLLSIYIILSQINPNLLNLDPKLAKIGDIPKTPSYTTPYGLSPLEQGAVNKVVADEARVRTILTNQFHVGINKAACTAIGQRNCTSVGGLGEFAINGLGSLKSRCNCDVTVTGGTEWWLHSGGTSHQPGQSVVDLSPSTGLNDYLLGPGMAPSSGTNVIKNNAQYKYETTGDNGVSTGPHWHVIFN